MAARSIWALISPPMRNDSSVTYSQTSRIVIAAKRSIGRRVCVEEMQIDAKPRRSDQPEGFTKERAGCNPVPATLVHARSKVIDQRKR